MIQLKSFSLLFLIIVFSPLFSKLLYLSQINLFLTINRWYENIAQGRFLFQMFAARRSLLCNRNAQKREFSNSL